MPAAAAIILGLTTPPHAIRPQLRPSCTFCPPCDHDQDAAGPGSLLLPLSEPDAAPDSQQPDDTARLIQNAGDAGGDEPVPAPDICAQLEPCRQQHEGLDEARDDYNGDAGSSQDQAREPLTRQSSPASRPDDSRALSTSRATLPGDNKRKLSRYAPEAVRQHPFWLTFYAAPLEEEFAHHYGNQMQLVSPALLPV